MVLAATAGCNRNDRKVERQISDFSMKKTHVVASPFKGRLLKDGKPVRNRKLIHELRWTTRDDDPLIKEIITDSEGYFTVEEYSVELDLGMFQEFIGYSWIYAAGDQTADDGEPDYFMTISRTDFDSGEEFGEPPENMTCELNSELEGFHLVHGVGMTKCRWDNMYIEESIYE